MHWDVETFLCPAFRLSALVSHSLINYGPSFYIIFSVCGLCTTQGEPQPHTHV